MKLGSDVGRGPRRHLRADVVRARCPETCRRPRLGPTPPGEFPRLARDDKRRHFLRVEVDACKRLRGIDLFLSHEAARPFFMEVRGRRQDVGKTPINEVLAALRPRMHLSGHHHVYSDDVQAGRPVDRPRPGRPVVPDDRNRHLAVRAPGDLTAVSLRPFLEAIDERVLVCDGAMGTLLYAKGVFINRCFDGLNLTQPALVSEVHSEYVKAGADVIETNTFGANRIKLASFGLGDKVQAINAEGVKIAREASRGRAYVAGAMGPLGIRIEPWGKVGVDEAQEFFREQAEALAAAGVDLFIIETFRDLNEIRAAVAAVRPLVSGVQIGTAGRQFSSILGVLEAIG